MDPLQAVGGGAAGAVAGDNFEAAFEQALGDAIVGAGIVGGSMMLNQILQTFAESNAELDS